MNSGVPPSSPGAPPSSSSPSHSLTSIAIIGAGLAGRAFALECVRAGLRVFLEDVMPANLRRAEDILHTLPPSSGSFELFTTVEDAVRDADLAIDFVPDELESKLEIFSMIDRMAPPRTVVCTPTYALSITDLASCVYRPDRAFAVQGLTPPSAPVAPSTHLSILHPPLFNAPAASALRTFFESLGRSVDLRPDEAPVMLVKNAMAPPAPTRSGPRTG